MQNVAYSNETYPEMVLCNDHGKAMLDLPYMLGLTWKVNPGGPVCDACEAKGLDYAYGRAKRRAAARYEVPRWAPIR